MRRLTLALCALSCASHSAAAPPRLEAAPAPPASAPLATDLVGWMVLGDLTAFGDGGALKSELVSAIAAPELALALDPARPLVIGVLDWKQHPDEPVTLGLPLLSNATLKDGATIQRGGNATPLHVRVVGGIAYVAGEPAIAEAAPSLLGPILAKPQRSAVVARVLVPNLTRLAGDDIEKAIAKFMTLSSPEAATDARDAFGLRALRGVAPYLRAASAIEIRADATKAGVAISLDMEGPEKGEWADYVARRRPGPPWGLGYLPSDSILAFSTRLDARADADALAGFFGGGGDTGSIRPPIVAFLSTLPGELAYATWPAAGGGMGVGGAFATTTNTHAKLLAAYKTLGDAIGPTVAHELGVDPAKLRFDVKMPAPDKISGVTVDRLDLIPSTDDKDVQRVLDWMYGGDGVHMGIAFVGKTAVWAAGRDYQQRLATMISVARGHKEKSVADRPGLYGLDARGLVSTSWVSPSGLATFITRTLQTTAALGPDENTVLAPYLAPNAANDAIVTTTRLAHRPGQAVFEARTVIPGPVIGDIGHIGGAFWRVGLSLLTGPPPELPIPVPPRQVTPPPSAVAPSGPSAPGEGEPKEPTGPQPGLPPGHST
jgi:hypothetical protein